MPKINQLNLISSLCIIGSIFIADIATGAQKVKPVTSVNQLPSFADVDKKMEEDIEKKISEIARAIMKGKSMDGPSCKQAMKSCRGYLGKRGVVPGRVTFSVSYTLPYGDNTGVSQSDARTKLYEMAAEECDRINSSFVGECSLANFTIRAQNRKNQQPTMNGSAKYHVEQ